MQSLFSPYVVNISFTNPSILYLSFSKHAFIYFSAFLNTFLARQNGCIIKFHLFKNFQSRTDRKISQIRGPKYDKPSV